VRICGWSGDSILSQPLEGTSDPVDARTVEAGKLRPEGKLFFLDPEPAITEKRFYRTIAAPQLRFKAGMF